MASPTPLSPSSDTTLYLYTSLTAGSSHIVTATSRLETILKANRIPFQAIDVATDDNARKLWGRRAGKRTLPGLVRMGSIVGDLEAIEDWNEYGELEENIFADDDFPNGTPSTSTAPVVASATSAAVPGHFKTIPVQLAEKNETKPKDTLQGVPSGPLASLAPAMRQAGQEAAKKAGEAKAKASPTEASLPDEEPSAVSPEVAAALDRSAAVAPPSGTAEPPEEATARDPKDSETITSVDTLAKSSATRASATTSQSSLPLEPLSPSVTQHRGSIVAAASAEEIKIIEEKSAIPEEEEPSDEDDDVAAPKVERQPESQVTDSITEEPELGKVPKPKEEEPEEERKPKKEEKPEEEPKPKEEEKPEEASKPKGDPKTEEDEAEEEEVPEDEPNAKDGKAEDIQDTKGDVEPKKETMPTEDGNVRGVAQLKGKASPEDETGVEEEEQLPRQDKEQRFLPLVEDKVDAPSTCTVTQDPLVADEKFKHEKGRASDADDTPDGPADEKASTEETTPRTATVEKAPGTVSEDRASEVPADEGAGKEKKTSDTTAAKIHEHTPATDDKGKASKGHSDEGASKEKRTADTSTVKTQEQSPASEDLAGESIKD
ncbi:MAG: hypothetical protein M1832_001320 [Thelocarpon impressellum]|nr:MAG: hypothetical protein M1832_001320 [Thelocarpon impressellum]